MTDDNEKIEGWTKLEDLDKDSLLKYISTTGKLHYDLRNSTSYFDKLQSFKKFYLSNINEIIETFRQSKHLWFISYPTDWSNHLTGIEHQAWCSIRTIGRIVMYPQFPVQNFYLDFANPGLMIGLELDGKDFHNKEKDAERDRILKSLGWTIYRISGKEMCRTNYKTLYDIEYDFDDFNFQQISNALSYWLLETGDGVIQAIKEIYFEKQDDENNDDESDDEEFIDENYAEMKNEYLRLCNKTLELHKLC